MDAWIDSVLIVSTGTPVINDTAAPVIMPAKQTAKIESLQPNTEQLVSKAAHRKAWLGTAQKSVGAIPRYKPRTP
jgi:hypothetical protein